MIKQNVNIVNLNLLYKILEEIKEKLPFDIKEYKNEEDYTVQNNIDLKNSLIITNSNTNSLVKKNLLIFNNLPIQLDKLIETININLIKLRFNFQSKINIKKYELNLNSKFFSNNVTNLKLTQKEIEIILYLNSKKIKHSVLDLQKNIWGYSSELETHTVETHIYRLRKKINEKFDDNNFIMSSNDGYFIK